MAKADFSEIYNSCKNDVWRLVAKYVKSKEDREDLFQEVFVRVHKALPKFRQESSPATWVYRITVNTALNYVKKLNRYRWFKNLLGTLKEEPLHEAPTVSDPALLKPLQKLNPRQRMVLLLADVEERSLAEIAELLHLPIGTIKSNLSRAREIVRQEVEKNV